MKKEYSKKAEQKLLVSIYKKYVKNQGDQPAQLDVYEFNAFHNDLYETTPEILFNPLEHDKRPSVDSKYYTALRHSGFIERKYEKTLDVFLLTELGFNEAKRLVSPVLYFYKDHWKWIWGAVLTVTNITGGILRLMQCQ